MQIIGDDFVKKVQLKQEKEELEKTNQALKQEIENLNQSLLQIKEEKTIEKEIFET